MTYGHTILHTSIKRQSFVDYNIKLFSILIKTLDFGNGFDMI